MALYEHADVKGHFEAIADFLDSLRFGFTAAIREEDEGNAMLLEIAEGFAGAGKGTGAAEEDAIDTKDSLDLYVLEWGMPILKCKREVRDFGQDLSGCLQIVLPLPGNGNPQ